ncbi:MAG TPA: glycosyltransferase [Ktedonobacteraceae bacterium]|nr:glycosyltransferase [Ktedonobacteraceae bacterium]
MTVQPSRAGIPADILALSHERDELRRKGKYKQADDLKRQIEEAGYGIKDNPHGAHLIILPGVEIDGIVYRTSRHVPSLLDEADCCTFSVNILANNSFEATRRCLESIARFAGEHSIEIMLVDNGSQDGLYTWATALRQQDRRLSVLHLSRAAGEAEARNIGLKRSQGQYILMLDSHIELTGDVFTPLAEILSDPNVGVTGLRGLRTEDMRHFEETSEREVEAIAGSCMAFGRQLLRSTGLFDERFRYPFYMDIDFNFSVRNCGKSAIVTPGLPVQYHPQAFDSKLSDAERTRLTRRNFYRFLDKWGHRDDLLLEKRSF